MSKKQEKAKLEYEYFYNALTDIINERNNGIPFFASNYALDLNNICDFINYADKNESKEVAITDASAENIPIDSEGVRDMGEIGSISKNMTTKEVREVRTHANQQMDSLRYDLVKMLLTMLLTKGAIDEDGDIGLCTDWGMGTVANTMIAHGFIKRITNENEKEQ